MVSNHISITSPKRAPLTVFYDEREMSEKNKESEEFCLNMNYVFISFVISYQDLSIFLKLLEIKKLYSVPFHFFLINRKGVQNHFNQKTVLL